VHRNSLLAYIIRCGYQTQITNALICHINRLNIAGAKSCSSAATLAEDGKLPVVCFMTREVSTSHATLAMWPLNHTAAHAAWQQMSDRDGDSPPTPQPVTNSQTDVLGIPNLAGDLILLNCRNSMSMVNEGVP